MYNYKFIQSNRELNDNLEEICSLPYWTLDCETSGVDFVNDQLLLLQIGNWKKQYLIDTRKVNIESLREKSEDENYPKITVNGVFDYRFIKKNYGIELEGMRDCFIIEKLMCAGLIYLQTPGRFSMEGMYKKYFNKNIEKDVRSSFIDFKGREYSKEQLDYAALDVFYTDLLYKKQMPIVHKMDMDNIVDLECQALPFFGDLGYNGIHVNIDRWTEIAHQAEKNLFINSEKAESLLSGINPNMLGECDINIHSDSQLLEVLRNMGYKIDNVKEDTLLRLNHEGKQRKQDKLLGDTLIKVHQLNKAVGTFGLTFLDLINNQTKRIYPNWNQIGSASGRVACDKPNLMQLPRDEKYRSCFIGEDNNKIISTDYDSQELRIITDITKEPTWIDIILKGIDLHSVVGSLLFKTEVSKEKNKILRDLAKNLNFGVCYGAKWKKVTMFYEQARIPYTDSEVKAVVKLFEETYPSVVTVLDDIGRQALENGRANTLGGRPRFFNLDTEMETYQKKYKRIDIDAAKDSITRKAKNHAIQGTGKDQILLASIMLRKKIKRDQLDMKPIHLVHDETVYESFSDHKHNKHIIEKYMVMAQEEFQSTIPGKAEGIINNSWTKV